MGEDDGAFFANQPVQQRGFPDVRPSDDRDFDDVGLFFFLDGGHDADLRERGIEQIVHAGAVLGGDGENRNADAMENIGVGFLRHGVDLC